MILEGADLFWEKVMPAFAAEYKWGAKMEGLSSEKEWSKSLKTVLKKMDEAEFDIFLGQMVIKSSSKGVVGFDLTALVGFFRELRK